MGVSWGLIWELFHYAILGSALAGIVCPVLGCLLLVRRTGFYGIALPQFAAAGVTFGWALPIWGAALGWAPIDLEATALENPHAVKNYLLLLAGLFTFGGMFVLLLFGKHRETETGRVAAAFAIANAATILLASVTPHGAEVVDQLLRGEILTADLHEFETIAIAYGAVLLALIAFHRKIVLVSFDRETALVLGLPVKRIEGHLLILTGITVAVGVLIVGPIVLFGLLVIPPLAARHLARSMVGFFVLAAAFGLLASLGGILVSFYLDWPLGPALVAVAGIELLPALAIGKLRHHRVA